MFSTKIRYGRSALDSVKTCSPGALASDDQGVHLAVTDGAQRFLCLEHAGVGIGE